MQTIMGILAALIWLIGYLTGSDRITARVGYILTLAIICLFKVCMFYMFV